MTNRRPPVPDTFHRAVGGRCKWCAQPITYPAGHDKAGQPMTRRYWHGECADDYKAHAWPKVQEAVVVKRDGYCCRACGHDTKGHSREIDHIVPLWSVDRKAEGALRFWGPVNLQVLCVPCHKAKSAREAAERAAIKRQRKAPDLFGAAA